jgi:hypothetical protein
MALLTEPELVDLHTNAAATRPDAFLDYQYSQEHI